MNYYILALTCLLNNPLLGMQKVTHSETLVPGGKSANNFLFTSIA